jgi:isoleucyl-tRNA synthetase
VKEVAARLDADDGSLATSLAHGESVRIPTDAGEVLLGPGDVELVQETQAGWGVASDGGITVALELEVTPDLHREGLARELVRVAQDTRKAAGLAVGDRIELGLSTQGEMAEAIAAHRDEIASETLAVRLDSAEIADAAHRQEADIDGTPVIVTLRRA